MVLFVADLSEDTTIQLQFTPTNEVSRNTPSGTNGRDGVYNAWLGEHPTESYWLDWGGYYDNPIINHIELFVLGDYLIQVDSLEDCRAVPMSIFDDNTAGMVYVNIPRHPWLLEDIKVDTRKTVSFLSGAKNPDNPSDDVFNHEHWQVRLETPKLPTKLSDPLNGLTKYQTFDFTLANDDGYFDSLEDTNFFNAPSYIRKYYGNGVPDADGFTVIRYGMVESVKIDSNSVSFSCADIFRALEEPVSFTVAEVFATAAENKDKVLERVYGTLNLNLIKIIETSDTDCQFVIGENLTAVNGVYDKDGNPQSFTVNGGVIHSNKNAKYANVTGTAANKIGEIIKDVIVAKTSVQYVGSFWDIAETDAYVSGSPQINISFGKKVQDAVKDCLKSDMAFLIQKNNGKFTIRKWGNTYSTFTIANWMITQYPAKDYSQSQKYYLSSCIVNYNYDPVTKEYESAYLYNGDESAAETKYNKNVRTSFGTNLINETDAETLAAKISNRFSALRPTIKVGVGFDTSPINLLDTVQIDLTVNGRKIDANTYFVVTEIDPAQDVLSLEAVIS